MLKFTFTLVFVGSIIYCSMLSKIVSGAGSCSNTTIQSSSTDCTWHCCPHIFLGSNYRTEITINEIIKYNRIIKIGLYYKYKNNSEEKITTNGRVIESNLKEMMEDILDYIETNKYETTGGTSQYFDLLPALENEKSLVLRGIGAAPSGTPAAAAEADELLSLIAFDDIDQMILQCQSTTKDLTYKWYLYPQRLHEYTDFNGFNNGDFSSNTLIKTKRRSCTDVKFNPLNFTQADEMVGLWYRNKTGKEMYYNFRPKNCELPP